MSDSDDSHGGGDSARQLARKQVRAAGDRSSRLARELMKLPATTLVKLELDEDLQAAADRARAVTAMVARRRAERGLAGALRRVDLVDLEARLANVRATGSAEPELLHLAERWRARILAEGPSVFPGADADAELPRLVEKAQAEAATGKPPGAQRALYRHIVAALKARPQ